MAYSLINKKTRNLIDKDFKAVNPEYAKLNGKPRYFILNKLTAWVINDKQHRHNKLDGYYFLWCKERDKYFRLASDFYACSERLIEIIDDHYNPKGTTKAYAPTETAKRIILDRLMNEIDTPKPLRHFSGAELKLSLIHI